MRALATLAAGLMLAGCDQMVEHRMQDISDKVAEDAVERYEIAVSHGGSNIDACAQAGFVVAAYLQAHNSAEYERWKAIQTTDCAAAGVTR